MVFQTYKTVSVRISFDRIFEWILFFEEMNNQTEIKMNFEVVKFRTCRYEQTVSPR